MPTKQTNPTETTTKKTVIPKKPIEPALHIKADGTITEVVPANGKKFTLAELQGYVGGYIEVIPCANKTDLYVDEEGLMKDLPLNVEASRLIFSRVVGDAILIDRRQG